MSLQRIAAITTLGIFASIGIAQTSQPSQSGTQGTGSQSGAGTTDNSSNGGASSNADNSGSMHKRHHRKHKNSGSQDSTGTQGSSGTQGNSGTPYPSDSKPSGSPNNGSTTDSTRPPQSSPSGLDGSKLRVSPAASPFPLES